MAKDKKWIQNTYATGIQINYTEENGHAISFIFNAYRVDKISGKVISDGFTTLDLDQYEVVSSTNSFKKCVNDGRLVVYDEPPAAALSDVDRMLILQEEVRTLREENASLKKQLEALQSKEAAPAKPKSTKAKAE